ncbi:transcriptional regulator [Metallosphaera tengchongensis]|uniref:Transcriptional regulator n=1 Tax=Metallosphaera tengchongensis TaxID=1532350 RepID=A0A6N0NW02_9CREN|nr:transcriptional regulator [Metallosphaera tengchongensis]QKR00397.1 transcriptional regulator [Metallosphaera tengchongensis]
MSESFMTTRERILLLLKKTDFPLTAKEIMQITGIRKEQEVYDHIYHLALSSKHKNYVVILYPPKCQSCGSEISLEKPKRPSRCPKCKSERVSPPKFLIREKD